MLLKEGLNIDMPEEIQIPTQRIKSLEGLRVIALFLIVISHFEFLETIDGIGNIYSIYFHNAMLGVDFFFVLSGFGLMLSFLRHPIEGKITLKDSFLFAINKIKKLYPIVIFSLILAIPHLCVSSTLSVGGVFKVGGKLIIGASLLGSLTGMSMFSHAGNGVLWFYSCLFIIYLISLWICKFLKKCCCSAKKSLLFLVGTFLVIIALTFVFSFIDGKWKFDDFQYGSPYIRVFFVMLGMELALLYVYMPKFHRAKWIEIISFILCVAWFLTRNLVNAPFFVLRLIDVPLVVILVFSFSYQEGPLSFLFNTKFFQAQSRYTPYVYLLHYPIRMSLVAIIENYISINLAIGLIIVVTILALTIGLSILSDFLLQKWTSKLQKGQN